MLNKKLKTFLDLFLFFFLPCIEEGSIVIEITLDFRFSTDLYISRVRYLENTFLENIWSVRVHACLSVFYVSYLYHRKVYEVINRNEPNFI